MSLSDVFSVSGHALSAQSVRLNTAASNLAAADTVSSTEAGAYKGRHPVFKAVYQSIDDAFDGGKKGVSVAVAGIAEDTQPSLAEYNPSHPLANEDGYIYRPNINTIQEMTDMMSASRSYETMIETMNSTKRLLMKTLELGK